MCASSAECLQLGKWEYRGGELCDTVLRVQSRRKLAVTGQSEGEGKQGTGWKVRVAPAAD